MTSGATNNSGETVVIGRNGLAPYPKRLRRAGGAVTPSRSLLRAPTGTTGCPRQVHFRFPTLTHLSVSESRLAIAGYRSPCTGKFAEGRETNGACWDALDPSGLSGARAADSARIRREFTAQNGTKVVGSPDARRLQIAGQVPSIWFLGTEPVGKTFPAPRPLVHLLRSLTNACMREASSHQSLLLAWEGSTYQDITDRLPLSQPRDLAVSDDGLIPLLLGFPKTISVPLWFRRGEQWVGPSDWDSPELGNGLFGCTWIGNDLYLVGERATLSHAESLGLAIWHEPGPAW